MKKKFSITILICILSVHVFATHRHKTTSSNGVTIADDSIAKQEAYYTYYADSVEKSVKYQHGIIPLSNGIGSIHIPDGFKYIDEKQSEHILYDLWKNRKSDISTLGLILPESSGVLTDSSFVFNVEYNEIGYVKDDDADKIDYDDLLKDMKKETEEDNAQRKQEGYQTITLVGWATQPHYDKDRKILYWAKELKFGNDSLNTLNYNVRILGRKGVFVLNAIAGIDQLKKVQLNLPKVLDIVSFPDGNAYKNFDPGIDKMAAWTIGGLVAGKILAKVGLWAVIIKFWKVIMLTIGGGFATFRKKISALFKRKNKKNDDDNMPSNVIRPRDNW